ncbi:MAG: CPXCG motif-containing cysteine-rich protein [Methylovulum sp.]|nr:CPXCG motif-containing cysteine-rich protein [Methylovulum sp.]
MYVLQTIPIQCPYCGEDIDIVVDTSVAEQSYIEDCQVCCKPIEIFVSVEDGGIVELLVRSDDE